MPNRVIKESIKRSPQIDSLTWFEEVVFYRLIVTADDYGCVDGRMVLLKNELFPTRENITTKSIKDAIEKLAKVGLLCPYTVNDMPYLFFPTWEKHQRIRNKHRKCPEPILDSHLSADCGQMTADCQSESESNPNPNPIQSICAPVAALLLQDGSVYPVSTEEAEHYSAIYPCLDVQQELRKMQAWLEANPKNRKTKAGIRRFINGWLSRAFEKRGAQNGASTFVPTRQDNLQF